MKRPVTLIIMDGFGYSEKTQGNAVKIAKTPNIDKYLKECPNTLIGASGLDVGLPDGQMGNSEVGHTNIGAGKIIYQELTRITKSINDGDFFKNEEFLNAVNNCKKNNSTLHLFGLLSDGGVHSHNTHLYALLKLAKESGLKDVFVHCFMDGRDVSPTSGIDFVKDLQNEMEKLGVGKIGTISGRYYAMDRDNRWERVEKAYSALVYGEGNQNENAQDAVKKSYDEGVTDEFIVPTVVTKGSNIKANDSVISFNFRPDRAREIARTLVDDDFSGFERRNGRFPLYYVCMTTYDVTMPNVTVAFKPEKREMNFGEYVSSLGMTQLRIAETEKYAHVTFFFNGGKEEPSEGEDRALIPSPKVATYDLKPEMSAFEVTDEAVKRIESGKYDVIILNFANCDMVGHTGVFDAAVKAVETVDTCVGKVVDSVLKMGGVLCITADHGNSEQMIDPQSGDVFTAHTTNKVPFIVVGKDCKLRSGGGLSDIAPTLIKLMGTAQPECMSGKSLIE